MEYEILAGTTLGQLTDQVNEAIEAGWQPQGGAQLGMCDVSKDDDEFPDVRPVVIQAMVRQKEKPRESPYFGE